MDVHFLQTKPWQHFQESLGHKTFYVKNDSWAYLAILEQSLGIKRLYCPYGPSANSLDALAQAVESLKSLAKKEGAAFIRLQPNVSGFSHENARDFNLKAVHYSQPSHTWLLDLTKDKDTLLSEMKQNTRNICRNYAKKGLSHTKSTNPEDISHLLTLLHETAKHNHITVRSDQYLSAQATSLLEQQAGSIHLMRFEDTVVAAAFVYEGTSTNYYAHAASSFEHRRLNASTALLGEIIFNAQDQGKQTFDFFGIAPTDDPKHRWAGFTAFKKSFGGYEHTYSETYELSVNSPLHHFYSLAKKLRA
ncbi:MAG TPA: peptidoglycan bridge formation glycyltransferase FemA/FemB family protein [Candidatus Saccharimonadales bacterium]